MSDNDDNETQGVVFGVLAGVIFGIIALVAGLGMWKASQPAAPAAQVAAAEPDIAPIGDALAKVYFAVGKAELDEADKGIVAQTVEALAAKADGIVLLSGFHDPSGDPARNAELAKQRALAVRAVLVTQGVAEDKVELKKPEQALASGPAAEARRVEVTLK